MKSLRATRRDPLRGTAAILAVALGAASAACGSASPTQPTASVQVSISGTWSGSASDSSGPGSMTWQLTQTGAAFSGTLTMTDAATNLSGRGTVSGSMTGSSFRFSLSVPAGGFDDPFSACRADVTGDGQASSAVITATYSGTNSCTGSITSGQLSLAKSG